MKMNLFQFLDGHLLEAVHTVSARIARPEFSLVDKGKLTNAIFILGSHEQSSYRGERVVAQ